MFVILKRLVTLFSCVCFFDGGLAFGSGGGAGTSEKSFLNFFADGRVTALGLRGRNVVRTDTQERSGFALLFFDGTSVREIPLDKAEYRGDELHVGRDAGFPRLVFKVTRDDNYLGLNLIRAEGIPMDGTTGLVFKADVSSPVEVVRLDYMAEDNSSRGKLRINWPYISDPKAKDEMLGGVAFFLNGTDAQNDLSLATIWSNEHLPRPDIGEPWTVERVQKWIDEYHTLFSGLSEATLSAASLEELYYLTDMMHKAGITRIYLHTDTWRGEYWPRRRGLATLNPEVFPNGYADLKRFSEYLRSKGMMLRLHIVSGGIGRMDPEFVTGGKVERNLANWVEGELVEPVNASAKTLRFRPKPGSYLPEVQVSNWWDFTYFRVGEEIVRSKSLLNVDQDIWTLEDAERGYDSSRATSHAAGTSVAGLMSAYGQNYVPEVTSPLFDEIVSRYAYLINEGGVYHQHYDGAEIHNYPLWGRDKFSYEVAGKMKRPTTTSTSGGRGTPWQLERRFSKGKGMIEANNYWSLTIPVQLDGHRRASSLLDAHYEIAAGLMKGGRRIHFQKPEPMFGVSKEWADGHGLMPEFMELSRQLAEVVPQLSDEHIRYLSNSMTPIRRTLRQRGNHFQSRDVPFLEKRADGYYWVPTRVLIREGMDDYWIYGQEFGAVGPRQYLQSGQTVELDNPNPAQAPMLVLRALPAYVAQKGTAARQGGSSGASGSKQAAQDDYATGTRTPAQQAAASGSPRRGTDGAQPAGGLFPADQGAIRQAGLSRVTLDKGVLTLKARNQFNNEAWSEEAHASWNVRVPQQGRTAIEIEVEGDGSGAVLVVQLVAHGNCRDYPVLLDFKGKRTIVIPSGEAAWSTAYWGWRFGTKMMRDEHAVSMVRLGIGYIPPNRSVDVQVSGLRLLDSVDVVLRDVAISAGQGKLTLNTPLNSGEYFVYSGGNSGKAYDKNWNFLRDIAVRAENWEVPQGKVQVQFATANRSPEPWAEIQLLTRGEPFKIADLKDKAAGSR